MGDCQAELWAGKTPVIVGVLSPSPKGKFCPWVPAAPHPHAYTPQASGWGPPGFLHTGQGASRI